MEIRIKPEKLMEILKPMSTQERGVYITHAVYKAVNKCADYPWIIKERKKKKQELGDYSEAFLKFWEMYPKKRNKGFAYKEWIDLPLDEGSKIVQSLLALEWQRQSEAWTKEGGKYIPNPENYLKARGFEDEKPDTPERGEEYIDCNGIRRFR